LAGLNEKKIEDGKVEKRHDRKIHREREVRKKKGKAIYI